MNQMKCEQLFCSFHLLCFVPNSLVLFWRTKKRASASTTFASISAHSSWKVCESSLAIWMPCVSMCARSMDDFPSPKQTTTRNALEGIFLSGFRAEVGGNSRMIKNWKVVFNSSLKNITSCDHFVAGKSGASIFELPPWKLTYPLNNDGWKMYFLLK